MTAHALLSASSAFRWLHCPPSAKINAENPQKGGRAAEEGTLAHAIGEGMLRQLLFGEDKSAELERLKKDKLYHPSMSEFVEEYVTEVAERFQRLKQVDEFTTVHLEHRLDYSEWVPEGFGTGDAVMMGAGVIEIVDLKYGFQPVPATNNPQLRLYALGACSELDVLDEVHTVRMTIVQPRLDAKPTTEISKAELLAWAEEVVVPAAKQAAVGLGDFCAGDHCKYCAIAGNCRARADEMMKLLSYEFQEPATLSNEEVAAILPIAAKLDEWRKDLEEYAFDELMSQREVPGWKLVLSAGKRSIQEPEKAAEVLLTVEEDETKVYRPREIRTLTDLEKIFGKKRLGELLKEHIVKPQGKPKLAPETDPRPAFQSVEQDFKDEKFEEEI